MISEKEMLAMIMSAKRIFLLEPDYRRKYPPLGLAKIAALAKSHGSEVRFDRHFDGEPADLICCTTLFTTESFIVNRALAECTFMSPEIPVLVGGIYASLMPHAFSGNNRYVFQGYSAVLDQTVPDYSIDWAVQPPWDKYSFNFTTRGCPNRCPYCAVPRIEPKQCVVQNWKEHIVDSKPYAMISDNNLSAYPEHLLEVAEYLRDKKKKKVIFDNGLDCKLIMTDIASSLSNIRLARCGLRLAFDRIEEDGVFQKAIELLKSSGVSKNNMMAYVLFNFNDTPQEAHYRMKECLRLGIWPYPQRYEPILRDGDESKEFVGKYWTSNLVKLFRFYWMRASHYRYHEFLKWLKIQKRHKVYEEDIQAWNEHPFKRSGL